MTLNPTFQAKKPTTPKKNEIFGKFGAPLTISVHLLKHLLQLLRPGELAQGAHDPAQLLFGDAAVAVLVKQPESLPKL